MSQSEGIFESRDGMPIRYRREGAGAPVILVHGVGANLESWDAIAERLVSNSTVLRADLRGHGKSGRMTDCEMSDFVADVFALADEQGLSDFALVGFSLGGLIAQCCALDAPGRLNKMVLISTVARRTPEERTRVIERTKLLARDGVRAVTGAAAERWFTPDFKAGNPERVAQRLEELAANDPQSYLAAYRVFGLADEGLPLSDIRTPTLIMTGEDDPGSNPRMSRLLHDEIEGSQLEILPGLRHSVLLEAPGLIADRIERFLAR